MLYWLFNRYHNPPLMNESISVKYGCLGMQNPKLCRRRNRQARNKVIDDEWVAWFYGAFQFRILNHLIKLWYENIENNRYSFISTSFFHFSIFHSKSSFDYLATSEVIWETQHVYEVSITLRALTIVNFSHLPRTKYEFLLDVGSYPQNYSMGAT